MYFEQTRLPGAYIIKPELKQDERGFFARTWCHREFHQHGLDAQFSQCSLSFNQTAATLRGMHYQAAPRQETKLVRCTAGAIYDVIIDLRSDSSTRCHWFGVELSSINRWALYIPGGFAHGFLTLADATEVLYQISEAFEPGLSRGVRWNDPAFGISWPGAPAVISARDAGWDDFK